MEAELFGYARGAFSGAVQRYDGQLMAAEGGTVFLDEIDDTPLETQTKLLRVLEDRVVSRLGENVWHEVDFRLLAATNRDLRAADRRPGCSARISTSGSRSSRFICCRCANGSRICRRWRGISWSASRAKRSARRSTEIRRRRARARSLAYPWPGNIRELRNVIYETLVYKRSGTEMLLSDLPEAHPHARRRCRAREPAVDRAAVARKIERGAMSLRDEVRRAPARRDRGGAQAHRRQRRAGRAAARRSGPRRRARSGRHTPGDDAAARLVTADGGCRSSQ